MKKELHSELRVRYALNALLMFVVVSIAVLVIALGQTGLSSEVLSALFWIVILFSAMSGLSRIFVSEEERSTTLLLQLISPSYAVYFGKLLFNSILTVVLSLAVSILYIIFFPAFNIHSTEIFIFTVLLGSLGFSSASTIIAAIIAKAQAKNTLYTVLAFPVLAPLLITVINTTSLSIQGGLWKEAVPQFQIMAGYICVVIGFSFLMFDYVWKD